MKKRDIILYGILIVCVLIIFGSDNSKYSFLAGIGAIITLGMLFIKNITRWIDNSKLVSSNYINLRRDPIYNEIVCIGTFIISSISNYNQQKSCQYYLEGSPINNYMDYLNSLNGDDRFISYLGLIIFVGFFVQIITKVVLKPRISSEGILLSDGEIIEFNDIKDITLKSAFFKSSLKLELELEKGNKVIYANSKNYDEIMFILRTYCLVPIKEELSNNKIKI